MYPQDDGFTAWRAPTRAEQTAALGTVRAPSTRLVASWPSTGSRCAAAPADEALLRGLAPDHVVLAEAAALTTAVSARRTAW
jgi:hypothetical protein